MDNIKLGRNCFCPGCGAMVAVSGDEDKLCLSCEVKSLKASLADAQARVGEIIEAAKDVLRHDPIGLDTIIILHRIADLPTLGAHTRMRKSEAKDIATAFFCWWFNQPGSNTQQGFDEWWAIRAAKKGE